MSNFKIDLAARIRAALARRTAAKPFVTYEELDDEIGLSPPGTIREDAAGSNG